jgi:hypothetical protein
MAARAGFSAVQSFFLKKRFSVTPLNVTMSEIFLSK